MHVMGRVCMCECACVNVPVCGLCVRVCTCACVHACMQVCVHVRMCACMCGCVHPSCPGGDNGFRYEFHTLLIQTFALG